MCACMCVCVSVGGSKASQCPAGQSQASARQEDSWEEERVIDSCQSLSSVTLLC